MKVSARTLAKAFQILRRTGIDDDGSFARTRFDYKGAVGTGLGSAVITAPALWVARQFPEAPIAVQDRDGELHFDHPLVQLIHKPNPWYGGGTMKMALALDFTVNGNGYLEMGRGRGKRPEELYYQPSFQIAPKGSDEELVTHYEHSTNRGIRRLENADVIQFRNGLDPNNMKLGLAPLHSLLREVFTDDEAANMTAAILRNLGVPGLIISAENPEEDDLGPEARKGLKNYFRKFFRGDQAGEALVLSGRVKLETLNVDLAKMNIDKLRQIPEERVTAVLGIPAAVVGFGTGLEQTKVGATLKELRELAYENVIIPMQRVFAEELDRTLLPEFEPNPDDWHVVFDNSSVRVLQEDESRAAERNIREFQGGIITRAEARTARGREALSTDEVYRQGYSDVMVQAGAAPDETPPASERRSLPEWVIKSLRKDDTPEGRQRERLFVRFLNDREDLASAWADDLKRQFDEFGREVAAAWLEAQTRLASRNGQRKADLPEQDRAIIDEFIVGLSIVNPDYEAHYLRVMRTTHATVESVIGLGVDLSDPIQRSVVAAGGTRKGLIDFTEQARESLYRTLAQARSEGAGPQAIARMIREQIPAGPWSSSEVRAEVIARTETKWAQNVSAMEIYRNAENVTGIQIFDARIGDQHDQRCIELDGRTVSVEEAAAIEPLEHPNCSRSFAPVVGAPVEANT